MASASWAESVNRAMEGEESEVSAIDPMLLGGVSDDPKEPEYDQGLPTQAPSDPAMEDEQVDRRPLQERQAPAPVARLLPQSPGHSELSRMEKGAHWEIDDEELVPDYNRMLPRGVESGPCDRRNDQSLLPTNAMDVDRDDRVPQLAAGGSGGRVTNPAPAPVTSGGIPVEVSLLQANVGQLVQQQVSNIVQAQMAPLFTQLFDRLEAMEARQSRLDERARVAQQASTEADARALAGNFAASVRISASQGDGGHHGTTAAQRGEGSSASVARGRKAVETSRSHGRDEASADPSNVSGHADQGSGLGEQTGVVEVAGVPHAWRLTSDGLQLQPLSTRKPSTIVQPGSQNIFDGRAHSPFEATDSGSKLVRSRSASPAKKRATSEGRAQDIKGSRALRATISDPVPVRAPVFEAPARNSPESFVNPCKPRIVYPLSPGGTEIKPPPGGPPHSPIPDAQGQGTVLKQVPYPWPAPGGALWGSSPLTAPPGLSEEIRMGQECSGSAQPGPEYKSSGGDPLIQGLGSSGDVPANQGSRSGDQVSKGLEWFFDSMKKALTSYGDGEVRAEEVKTSLAELPKLVINEADKDLSPLLAGDWLTLSGPTMRDLSATSVQWWDQVLQAATDYYQAWLRATPDELVSTQKMTCIDAVALVYCTYQPGGLKVSIPDPTLLLAGLDGLTAKASDRAGSDISEEARQNMFKEVTAAIKQLTASAPAAAKEHQHVCALKNPQMKLSVGGDYRLDGGSHECYAKMFEDDCLLMRTLLLKADPEALRALAPRKVRTSFADHVAGGHVPFRADCRHCLEGRLRARPHRRQPAAESFVLSLDLMGPHRGGRDEVLDEVRYALVAVYTFPETLGVGGVAAPNDPDHGPPVDPEVQPWEEPEEPDPEEAAVAEAPVDLSDEAELPRVPMVELLWVEPLRRKTEAETLRATKRIKAAISLLGLPIVRIHTDAGKEFCNKSFRAWCSDNAFVKSCTGADDFRSNGRVENAIGVLKGRARTLLRAADSEWQDWPFALRHAAAQHRMFNFQRLGWKTEGLKPFNALVHVQERSWRIGEWGRRAVPARILAPAQEVERAYVVRTEDGNLRNVKVLFGGVREGPPVADDAPPERVQDLASLSDPSEQLLRSPAPAGVGWGGGGPGELARTGTRAGSIGAGGCDARDAREEPGERSGENQAEDQLRACAEGNGPTDMGCCESLESVEGLTVFEAPECGFFVDATSCEEDSSIGCMWDGEGFEAFENRALNLKMMIDRECEFLKREAQTLEDCAVSEEFLVKAVRALGQAQDKAVEKAPEEVEFSLLPDCEILSSHTVPLQEVYKHFHLWRKAAEQELQSLIEEKGAFKRASLADLKRLEERGTKVVMVPGKAIFTRKSGGRFKCRVVICGNFVPQGSGNGDSQGDQASLYAAGCEVSHVRQIAARGARVGWAGFLLDIKTAFLNSLLLDPIKPRTAPPPTMTENPAEIIAVKPPKILIAHGLAKSDEYFLCLRAVYGLPQSPRDWGITRDVTIAGMEIVVPPTDVTPEEMPSLDHSTREALGKVMKLVPSASDSQVWALRVANADCDLQPGPALAWIAVYVDDILIMGPRAVALAVVNKIKAAWETGSMKKIPQLIEGTASFFGIEFAWRGNQLILGQQGYIQDLMKRYPHVKLQTTPLPPGNFEIPELAVEEKDPNALRACQTSLGEMLWIATRTRPDLMYGVSKLASEMSRNPVATLPYIEHLLGYLFNTVDVALVYGPKVPTLGESGSVATVSGANVLEVHTDAGFAPLAGRSQECAILFQEGAIVTWLSSKQPFTAQSTAESELLSTMTGFNVGRAHQLLASELCGGDVRLVVLNDNQACLQIIQVDNASWRTRHLRIRAAALKEQYLADQVVVGYVSSSRNGADLGTKSVPLQRLQELMQVLGLGSLKDQGTLSPAPVANQSGVSVSQRALVSVVLLLCATEAETVRTEPDLSSEREWDFTIFVCMVAVCSIVVWEALKWLLRKGIWTFWVKLWGNRDIEEPEAELDTLSEVQPDHEDDLRELPQIGPPIPRPHEEPERQIAQMPVPQEVIRYVDDEVLIFAERAQAQEFERLTGVGAIEAGLRNRNLGQRIYREEPDIEPPEAPPLPPRPVQRADSEGVHREADARSQREQIAFPQAPLRPHLVWPVPVQLPNHEVLRTASPWGGPLSAVFQVPPAGVRDHFIYDAHRRPNVLIRWHGMPRLRLFCPSDARLPEVIRRQSLTGRRRTLIVHADGRTELRDDRFDDPTNARHCYDNAWRGRTELELRPEQNE
ncbi:GIP [Symbiodinium natans]|uniref:GIP protein n=1 Tax=Symbiodinium natans TaxID=878477 RepID=A0A812NRM2_9DINO|nr:GIP [Symbiodinium natans]